MKKTFLLGFVFGIGGAVWLAGWYPFVDPVRLPSESGVARNGGRTESFHVGLPEDRIARVGRDVDPVPASLSLPDGPGFDDIRFELFRLRSASGKIVGVASRIRRGGDGGYTDWTLFLPARGALFLGSPDADPAPYARRRGAAPVVVGRVLQGSGEFSGLTGSFREDWRISGRDAEGWLAGEIELMTVTQDTGP
ncbi:MAG: hypothetical protein P8172_02375 [Gammaproteobacteria bacterium]